jgi:hypothetical protein
MSQALQRYLPCAVLAAALTLSHAHATTPTGPSLADCESRANGTATLLGACIQTPWIYRHLARFQSIADANKDKQGHGNRDAGTPGYFQSVAYAAERLTQAGYAVTIQPYQFSYNNAAGAQTLRSGATAWRHGQDWFAAIGTAGGHVQAQLAALGANAALPGCNAADFATFPAGSIALLPEGVCTPAVKIANAVQANASGLIIYRTQQAENAPAPALPRPARLGMDAPIPVAAYASAAIGENLRAQILAGHAPHVTLAISTHKITVHDANLIADAPTGDSSHTVVIDAHLDSIFGPGILDNASGSATILEIALKLAHTPTRNHLRFIFFGGEELGLHGSAYYTKNLSPAGRAAIAFDLDADVTASPNFDILIADPGHAPNVKKFPPNVVPQSQIGNTIFANTFTAAGITSRIASFGNDGTDSNDFSLIGIPNSGVLTQQDCCKQTAEVKLWGGFLGNYEGQIPGHNGGCVDFPHRWCDTIANIDSFVLEFVTRATALTTLQLANQDFSK